MTNFSIFFIWSIDKFCNMFLLLVGRFFCIFPATKWETLWYYPHDPMTKFHIFQICNFHFLSYNRLTKFTFFSFWQKYFLIFVQCKLVNLRGFFPPHNAANESHIFPWLTVNFFPPPPWLNDDPPQLRYKFLRDWRILWFHKATNWHNSRFFHFLLTDNFWDFYLQSIDVFEVLFSITKGQLKVINK